jgi:hypothetical protein
MIDCYEEANRAVEDYQRCLRIQEDKLLRAMINSCRSKIDNKIRYVIDPHKFKDMPKAVLPPGQTMVFKRYPSLLNENPFIYNPPRYLEADLLVEILLNNIKQEPLYGN